LPNDIYIVTHISISNIKLFFTLIILFFFPSGPNQLIIMISEGSCDTEDCGNNADNSALPSHE